MQFVIFHGSFGSPDSNWFPQLKEQLESLGQTVFVPKFPVDLWEEVTKNGQETKPKNQNLDNWLKAFDETYRKLDKKDKICFVGHSLGCIFILHVISKYNIKLDSAIFVSPFFDTLHRDWQIDHVNQSFYKIDFDFGILKENIPVSYVLYSENDPYVEKNHSILFSKALDSSIIYVRKAGHMNSEVNLNEFPLISDLCNTRLDLSLWQQYLAHRRQIFGIDFIRKTPESMALFKPEEIFDWSVFLYQHLLKEGFCTFYTGIANWDNKSAYYESARTAAKRIDSFVRVFLVEQLSDLRKINLREQINLDLQSGIKVYLCLLSDVQDVVGEVDFGLWDDEYLCIVKIGDKKEAVGVEINTKSNDIEKAKKWREVIQKHAVQITNSLNDIDNFISRHEDQVLYLTPEEVIDEGIFKFRHLRNEGFSTQYLQGMGFWDTQSKYLEEARRAAERVKNLTRVFIARSIDDFKNPSAQKQIEEDIKSGIKVFICKQSDVLEELKTEPDFGIWDNEYVCIVNFNEKNQATRAKLTNRKEDVEKANMWKVKILENAKQIDSFEEILTLLK